MTADVVVAPALVVIAVVQVARLAERVIDSRRTAAKISEAVALQKQLAGAIERKDDTLERAKDAILGHHSSARELRGALQRLANVGQNFTGDVDPSKNLPPAAVDELVRVREHIVAALNELETDGGPPYAAVPVGPIKGGH